MADLPETDNVTATHGATASQDLPPVTIATILGTRDEGILFGALIVAVFLFVFVIEYVRTIRARTNGAKDLRREQYANAAVWGVMLTMAAGGAVIAPNDAKRRDVSILLTCGAALQLLSFGLLFIAPRRSCPDDSLPRAPADFVLLVTCCLAVRFVVEMKWDGYLPMDRTGDGCIQILEGLSLLCSIYHLVTKREMSKTYLKRATRLMICSIVCGQLCFGELDGSPKPDKAFATSVYMEICAWACMFRYIQGRGRDAVNNMFLPPMFVQGMCRAYFWFMAFPEMRIRSPVSAVQSQFPLVMIIAHVGLSVLALGMSVTCVREFNPALPHKLLSTDEL